MSSFGEIAAKAEEPKADEPKVEEAAPAPAAAETTEVRTRRDP